MTVIGTNADGKPMLLTAALSEPSVYDTSVAALIVADRVAEIPEPAAKVPADEFKRMLNTFDEPALTV